MINEKRKFLAYEKARIRGLYNMLDWLHVSRYIAKYYKIGITKDEYLFIIENYSRLKEKYLK